MNYLLCTITSENYDVHFWNNSRLFKFLNAATTATVIQRQTQRNQECCSIGLLGDCLIDVFL